MTHAHTPPVTMTRNPVTKARPGARREAGPNGHRPADVARVAAGPVLTALLSLAACAQALRLWEWRPGTPLSLSGDAPYVLAQITSILEGNWYSSNPRVGAPFGLNQSWFTTADVINFATIRAIGFFTDSVATVGAVFFILGFPLAALAAYWLGRELGLSRGASVVVGVLFSVLPGHQEWFHHLWLAAYWSVPLAVGLVIRVARGERLWPRAADLRAGGTARRAIRGNALRTTAVLIAIGLSDVYYVAFTLLLLAVVLVFHLATGTRSASLASGVVATGVIAGLCGLSLLVATRGRGTDLVTGALPAQRVIGESEMYAGRLIDLVLPWYEHRAEPLRFLTYMYGVAAPPSVERPALGLVALAGAVALLATVLSALALTRRTQPLIGLLAALLLICLAFYTRGGLGSVVALFLTPQIRTWSRFVVFIGLLGLLAVGLWITSIRRRRGARAAGVVAAVVLLVGVLDQTSPDRAPDYEALSAQTRELRGFSESLASTLGSDCTVLQLPVVSFPEEPPPGSMDDYDHLLPAISSPAALRWSYGAIRGTQRADWQLALPVGDQERLVEDAAAAGFCAVEVDRDGYSGSTDPSTAIERLTGPPVALAPDARLAAYDLRPLRQSLLAAGGEGGLARHRDAVLRPVIASLSGSLIDTTETEPFQWTGPTTVLTVSNMGSTPARVNLSLKIAGVGALDRTVTIRTSGRPVQTARVSAQRSEEALVSLNARPGRTVVEVSATGDAVPVPGTERKRLAALKISAVTLATQDRNSASLQQFAAVSPGSHR